MSRQRLVLFPIGGMLGVGLVLLAALLLPSAPAAKKGPLAGCTRSHFIRVEFFCGSRMAYRNPDGSLVWMKLENHPVVATHPQAPAP